MNSASSGPSPNNDKNSSGCRLHSTGCLNLGLPVPQPIQKTSERPDRHDDVHEIAPRRLICLLAGLIAVRGRTSGSGRCLERRPFCCQEGQTSTCHQHRAKRFSGHRNPRYKESIYPANRIEYGIVMRGVLKAMPCLPLCPDLLCATNTTQSREELTLTR